MSGLLAELLAGLEQVDPAKAEQLKAELAAGPPAEPPPPPTLLDDLRNEDADDLLVTEVPSSVELPIIVGVLVKSVFDLTDRVTALEKPAPATSGPPPVSAGAGSITEPPAPTGSSVPADSVPPAANVPPPAPEGLQP